MKSKFFPIILFSGFMLTICSVEAVYSQAPQNEKVKKQCIMYTCSVHPEVVQDHAGKCTKCDMKLVEKKDMSKGDMHQKCDTTCKHQSHDKMKCDSTSLNKDKMMHDTTTMKHKQMEM